MHRREGARWGQVQWTLVAGWLIALATAVWLGLVVTDGDPRSRGGPAGRGGVTPESALGDTSRPVPFAGRPKRKNVRVLIAIDRAGSKAKRGEAVDARRILWEFGELQEQELPTLEEFRALLDRVCRKGLAIRNSQRSYSLTTAGRELLPGS